MRTSGYIVLRQTILVMAVSAVADYAPLAMAAPIDGRSLFQDSLKGNCAACHQISPATPPASASRIGPPLSRVREQIPDRAKLRDIIRDASSLWPDTVMPPYGRHRILTDSEIEAIATYVETL